MTAWKIREERWSYVHLSVSSCGVASKSFAKSFWTGSMLNRRSIFLSVVTMMIGREGSLCVSVSSGTGIVSMSVSNKSFSIACGRSVILIAITWLAIDETAKCSRSSSYSVFTVALSSLYLTNHCLWAEKFYPVACASVLSQCKRESGFSA